MKIFSFLFSFFFLLCVSKGFGLKPESELEHQPEIHESTPPNLTPPRERPTAPEKPEASQGETSLDGCWEDVSHRAQQARQTTSVRGQEQELATKARTFLELISKVKEAHPDYEKASRLEKLYLFLDQLAAGDPLRDPSHLWYNKSGKGISIPQNYQSLVTTLREFPKVSDEKAKLKILKNAVDHLGWLTSSNFRIPPFRGSGFTDNRYLYDYAKSWLKCLENGDPFRDLRDGGEAPVDV